MGEHYERKLREIAEQEAFTAAAAVRWYREQDETSAERLRERVKFLLQTNNEIHHAQLLDLEQLCSDWIASGDGPQRLAETVLNHSHLSERVSELRANTERGERDDG